MGRKGKNEGVGVRYKRREGVRESVREGNREGKKEEEGRRSK